MIIPAVRSHTALIGKVRDMRRIAAGIPAIACIREKQAHDSPVHDGPYLRHGPFHFIEHNPLEARRITRAIQVPALLKEDIRIGQEPRREHCIQIHACQVQKIPA